MSNLPLLISYCVLWLLVLCLCMTVYVLARHVGMLHIRTGNASARITTRGPEIGSSVNEVRFRDLEGQDVIIGGRQERPTLLVFISPGCGTCDELLPALNGIARHEKETRLVIMAVAEEAETQEYVKRHHLMHLSIVCSKEFVTLYGIGGIPHALLLDRDGIVRSKGIVNTAVHLESILNVVTTGYSSSQSRVLASEDF